jgi:hypothetical protein
MSEVENDVDEADLDEGDYADLGELDEATREEIANDIAEETADADQEEGGSDGGEDLEHPETADVEDVVEGDVSVGHVYCRSLGLGAAVMVSRYDEEADSDEMDALVEEYADLAKQTDLDRYMDQWFEQQMGRSEMSAGQGVAVGTLLFVAMVAMQNPAVAEGLAGEVGV